MTAIMGSGPGMKGGPYKLLKFIRIWRSNICDDGAAAIVRTVDLYCMRICPHAHDIQAEVLRLGGIDVQIQYLELLDNNIGPRGGLALGTSLSRRHNLSLLTLKLDYNTTLGTEGIVELCKGLRTNCTLKQVSRQEAAQRHLMASHRNQYFTLIPPNILGAFELLQHRRGRW